MVEHVRHQHSVDCRVGERDSLRPAFDVANAGMGALPLRHRTHPTGRLDTNDIEPKVREQTRETAGPRPEIQNRLPDGQERSERDRPRSTRLGRERAALAVDQVLPLVIVDSRHERERSGTSCGEAGGSTLARGGAAGSPDGALSCLPRRRVPGERGRRAVVRTCRVAEGDVGCHPSAVDRPKESRPWKVPENE
jgi:hypothetical protein